MCLIFFAYQSPPRDITEALLSDLGLPVLPSPEFLF
jgi:hypothetical protein